MKMSGYTIVWIVVGGIVVLGLKDIVLNEISIQRNGIEITAVVRTCKKENVKYSRSTIKKWVSRAYYTVKGEEYSYSIHAIVPIGTEVKVKYAPRDPKCRKLVNPHEFDDYPKDMEKQ
jgi:hypothetical protein